DGLALAGILANLWEGTPSKAESEDKLMRQVRYGVAMSLDGYIAGPNGEADWIIMDPEIDFKAIYSQFDTMLMGRRTFEGMKAAGGGGSTPGMQVFVFSRP